MTRKWINPRGNNCEFQMLENCNVDYYDEKFQNTNWQRLETNKDSSNCGLWVNSPQLKILVFADGGQVMTTCKDRNLFQVELDNISQLYSSRPSLIA
jgi:hypothetical protein